MVLPIGRGVAKDRLLQASCMKLPIGKYRLEPSSLDSRKAMKDTIAIV